MYESHGIVLLKIGGEKKKSQMGFIKGEVQSRITIISKERVNISP